jgi:hypothetical protein
MSLLNKILGAILGTLIVGFLWLNWPFSGQTTQQVQAVGASETATAVIVPTTTPTIVVSNLALDESGNLLYLNSEWESIRENPETATGTVTVPAGRVIWGDRLTFIDCEGKNQNLVGPAIMALPCEAEVSVTWGAYALDERVTVELAKEFLDRQYDSKSGFPDAGFAIFLQ